MTGSKQKIYLTDTTLRDGEQSPDIYLSTEIKVAIARLLDNAGFFQIEAGIPAMGTREKDTICRIMDIRKSAKIAVWNRMDIKDIHNSFDCIPDIIHISAPVSDQMLYSILNKDKSWLIRTLRSCVSEAKNKDYEVTVGFQDASRADISFMIYLAVMLKKMGVYSIRLADTIGILTPASTLHLIQELKNNTDIVFGIHTHNDFGMAAANAIEAAKAGIMFVDTTLFGIGERAGNCDSYIFSEAAKNLFEVKPSYKSLQDFKAMAANLIFSNNNKNDWLLNH